MASRAPIRLPTGVMQNLHPNATGVSGKTILVIVGLGVGGYLLYKHMKKGSSVELSGTDPVDVDDDDGDHEED